MPKRRRLIQHPRQHQANQYHSRMPLPSIRALNRFTTVLIRLASRTGNIAVRQSTGRKPRRPRLQNLRRKRQANSTATSTSP